MTQHELQREYYKWLCSKIRDTQHFSGVSYKKLLTLLNERDFIYILSMDSNRFEDGVDLRYRFAYEKDYEQPMIASYLDNKPCSILEMLVALSLRCEEHIMYNPDIGNRAPLLFWMMINNLGLGDMDDYNFDQNAANDILTTFLNREYSKDGKGGLVYIPNFHCDMRNTEIWYQIMWLLDEILKDD